MPTRRLFALPLTAFTMAIVAGNAQALAFKTGPSPAYPGCNIWLNDAGQPLRNKQFQPIGEESPCGSHPAHLNHYKVVQGIESGTLAIKDDTHKLVCILQLAPGSKTIIVPKICQRFQ